MLKPKSPERSRPVHLPGVERFNQSLIYFVTVCTHQRGQLLASESAQLLLRDVWTEASDFRVGCYVLMPDHLHLFCASAIQPEPSLKRWIEYWKSISARRWPVSMTKLWQRDFWDTQLRNGDSYSGKWHYVKNNPVRAGLVADSEAWPYQGEMHRLEWHD